MKTEQIVAKIEELQKLHLESAHRIVALEKQVVSLEESAKKLADRRGPKSDREMTDDDARRIMGKGDMSAKSHKECAEALGLSYAQVYSARKGFTFKHIAKEIADAEKKAKESTTPAA